MGACCDGNGHGSSGTPTSAELLPAYHWFVGAAHVRPAAVRRRSFAGSRRAGHARPLPHDDIKKAQKAAAMRFLHSCGFITLFYALTYPASRARHRSCGCSGHGSCLRRSNRRWRPCRHPAGQRAQTPEWCRQSRRPTDATRRGHSARAGSGPGPQARPAPSGS